MSHLNLRATNFAFQCLQTKQYHEQQIASSQQEKMIPLSTILYPRILQFDFVALVS